MPDSTRLELKCKRFDSGNTHLNSKVRRFGELKYENTPRNPHSAVMCLGIRRGNTAG